jgi:hypothetical protein
VLRIGRHFQFDVPDGWEESREGSRWVYRGPQGEELIISSSFVEGHGSQSDLQTAEQQLFANAMAAATRGASQEGLVVVVPLKRDEAITEFPCWSFASETPQKDAVFLGAVLSSGRGVLFATLEGPYSPDPFDTFRRFLKSVRSPVN